MSASLSSPPPTPLLNHVRTACSPSRLTTSDGQPDRSDAACPSTSAVTARLGLGAPEYSLPPLHEAELLVCVQEQVQTTLSPSTSRKRRSKPIRSICGHGVMNEGKHWTIVG